MNIAIILAAGVGQRMRSAGLPKQFLKLFGKPIIVYTLEKFEQCEDIDRIVIVCREGYLDHLRSLLALYHIGKVERVVVGGRDRQESLLHGLDAAESIGTGADDIVVSSTTACGRSLRSARSAKTSASRSNTVAL